MKKKSKNLINILVLILASVGIVIYFLKDDFYGIISTIKQANWLIILIAFGFQSIVFIFDALIYVVFARKYRPDYSFKEALQNSFIGHFFSYITPSATGGQFAQAYAFEKQDIKVENGSSILVMEFIARELVLVLYCGFTIAFKYKDFSGSLNALNIFGLKIGFLWLAAFGFLTHFIGLGGIIFLSYSKAINRFTHFIVRILGKMKMIKDVNKAIDNINIKIDMYRKELADIRGNLKPFLIACLMIFLRLTFVFICPFIVAIALGVHLILPDIGTAIVLASYVFLIIMFIPLPGASGGAEAVFMLLFSAFFGTELLASSGMLIWRSITFYYPFLIGLIVVLSFNHKRKTQMFVEINDEYKERFYGIKKTNENEEKTNV